MSRPWQKITFDPLLPGYALVSVPGKVRKRKVPGQWVVFDRDNGPYTTASRLFASGHIQACHAWIDAERRHGSVAA